MTDLATRVEQASGPSRELDAEIALHFGWEAPPKDEPMCGLPGRWKTPSGELKESWTGPPYFTSSVDAAMTLAPKGMFVIILRMAIRQCLGADCDPRVELPRFICANFLRAREGDER